MKDSAAKLASQLKFKWFFKEKNGEIDEFIGFGSCRMQINGELCIRVGRELNVLL